MAEERDRVQTLLTDTVVLLCKNGLSYQRNLCIQGLIGVTVDDDVFLVHFNELFQNTIGAVDVVLKSTAIGGSKAFSNSQIDATGLKNRGLPVRRENRQFAARNTKKFNKRTKVGNYIRTSTSDDIITIKDEVEDNDGQITYGQNDDNEALMQILPTDSLELADIKSSHGGVGDNVRDKSSANSELSEVQASFDMVDNMMNNPSRVTDYTVAIPEQHAAIGWKQEPSIPWSEPSDGGGFDVGDVPWQYHAGSQSTPRKRRAASFKHDNLQGEGHSFHHTGGKYQPAKSILTKYKQQQAGSPFVVTKALHECGYPECGKQFRHKQHLLRHQTQKHGRLPTRVLTFEKVWTTLDTSGGNQSNNFDPGSSYDVD